MRRRRDPDRQETDRHPGAGWPAARANLYLLGTGTGLAPFLSLVRDPDVYERFEKVIVTHTVREVADLNYRDLLARDLAADPDLGEMVAPKLIYYPTVTREPFQTEGRITDLIASGRLFADIGLPAARSGRATA